LFLFFFPNLTPQHNLEYAQGIALAAEANIPKATLVELDYGVRISDIINPACQALKKLREPVISDDLKDDIILTLMTTPRDDLFALTS
jgi:hypothetical protein